MDTRFRTVVLLVLFFTAAFILRLFSLQVWQPEWKEKAVTLTSDRHSIPPSRGCCLTAMERCWWAQGPPTT